MSIELLQTKPLIKIVKGSHSFYLGYGVVRIELNWTVGELYAFHDAGDCE